MNRLSEHNLTSGSDHKRQVPRFILLGIGNAVITISVYEILLLFMHYQISYIVAWLIGIIYVVYIYPRFVFQLDVDGHVRKLVVAMSYLLSYITSATVLEVATQGIGIPSQVSIIIAIGVTVVVNYLVLNKICNMLGSKRDC
jgi:putative flippase GtrA